MAKVFMDGETRQKKNRAIGMRLNTLLAQHDTLQKELAEEIGVCRRTVSGWVNGDKTVDALQLAPIADFFGVSVDWILRGRE